MCLDRLRFIYFFLNIRYNAALLHMQRKVSPKVCEKNEASSKGVSGHCNTIIIHFVL